MFQWEGKEAVHDLADNCHRYRLTQGQYQHAKNHKKQATQIHLPFPNVLLGEHEEDVDTIGGLIFDITGRVPVRGEVVSKNGFEFRVLEADPRRIKRIELVRPSRRRARKN